MGEKKYTRLSRQEIELALANTQMKVGELAQLTLSSILQHPDFPSEYLEKFRCKDFSKKTFGLSRALLIRRREWAKAPQLPYYAEYLECNGKYYCLCSEWTERQLPKLKNWVNRHKIDLSERRNHWQLEEAHPQQKNRWAVVELEQLCQDKIIPCGRIKRGKGNDRLIKISKTDWPGIVDKEPNRIVFRFRKNNIYRLYAVSTSLIRETINAFPHRFSKTTASEYWSFSLNILSGKLSNTQGSPRTAFATCYVYIARPTASSKIQSPQKNINT